MLDIMVNGCNGRMGQIVCNLVKENPELNLVCGFDKDIPEKSDFPIYTKIEDIKNHIDIIIDFSIPVATFNILEYALKNKYLL